LRIVLNAKHTPEEDPVVTAPANALSATMLMKRRTKNAQDNRNPR
jgi:hypothetical protein